jgi:hypothetical protein
VQVAVRHVQQRNQQVFDIDFVIGPGGAERCGGFHGRAAGVVELRDEKLKIHAHVALWVQRAIVFKPVVETIEPVPSLHGN